ncbi:hypothetical protein [Pleionea sp. CnH1-48]|uniref:hypothetical protein n=1 Tax=Pleionea sp. CnH1-48 TaxID=2954494 RepID=UPI0020979A0A|nr:hypothetical protein [Pleionea sp. CnH1-48]MCO7227459.1 hypothetical protein [Pleionea sp. CnH1-48]
MDHVNDYSSDGFYMGLFLSSDVGKPLFNRKSFGDASSLSSNFSHLCQLLAQTKENRFVVSGFGESCWPLSIARDLPGFLAQLPELIKCAEQKTSHFALKFPLSTEQRQLDFHYIFSGYKIEASSPAIWRPIPRFEFVDIRRLQQLLVNMRSAIAHFILRNTQDTSVYRWIKGWAA